MYTANVWKCRNFQPPRKFCYLNGANESFSTSCFYGSCFLCSFFIYVVSIFFICMVQYWFRWWYWKGGKKYDFELWPLMREKCFLILLYHHPVSSAVWWKCCGVISFSHAYSRKSKHPTSTKWQIFKCSDNPVDDNGKPT